jgi:hypothetical protein
MAKLANKLKRVIALEALAWLALLDREATADVAQVELFAEQEHTLAQLAAKLVLAEKVRTLIRAVERAVETGAIPEQFDRADGLGELISTGLKQYDPRVAFQASLRSAYAAGREDRIDRDDTITHVVRRTMRDARVRSSHAVLEGLVLPKADRAREGLYAPLGSRCRCIDVGIDQEGINRLRARGVKLQFEVPALRQVTHVNKFTGEKETLPECTEPGWGRKQNTPEARENLAQKLRFRMKALAEAKPSAF